MMISGIFNDIEIAFINSPRESPQSRLENFLPAIHESDRFGKRIPSGSPPFAATVPRLSPLSCHRSLVVAAPLSVILCYLASSGRSVSPPQRLFAKLAKCRVRASNAVKSRRKNCYRYCCDYYYGR